MRARTNVLEPAPPRTGDGNGGRGGWVWLVTANDVFEGQLLKGLLENAGVPVVLDGFDRGPFAWMYPSGNVRHPVQIFVPAGLLETARIELLESSFVAADRLPDSDAASLAEHVPADVAPGQGGMVAAATASAATVHNRLLRDRIRPTWMIVAILTGIVVGGVLLVQVRNLLGGPRCGGVLVREQGLLTCVTNP